jgi:hypothetical protein
MKTPFDPIDPLLQILAEDAADLPLKAAGEARQARAHHAKRRRQMAITATMLLCSACIWQFFQRGQIGSESVAIPSRADAPIAFPDPPAPHFPEPPEPKPREVAIARTETQAMNEPLPLPEGLTEEQASVVKAARGLPLLLVRDTAGRVARIHVIER